MPRRSSAERGPLRRGGQAGFTLMEAMVSLIILVIVMVVVLSLLFSMKSFAEKQQAFTAPRQTARRALDYVSQTLEGAGDWNQVTGVSTMLTAGHPYALVMLFQWGTAPASFVTRQASYNNLTGNESGNATFVVNPAAPAAGQVTSSKFGSLGTDVISVAFPAGQTSPVKIPIASWDSSTPSAVAVSLNYTAGCGVNSADPTAIPDPTLKNDAKNLESFQKAVGGPWSETGGGANVVSSLVILADGNGRWRLAQLTGMAGAPTLTSDCSQNPALSPPGNGQVISATLKDLSAVAQYAAPGGWRSDLLISSSFMIAGIDFVSFRHRTVLDPTDPQHFRVIGQLEQKSSGINPTTGLYAPGFFDPTADGTTATTTTVATTSFTPIVENVEDFQVAYIMRDSAIYNTAVRQFDNGGTQVPLQAQTPAAAGGGVDCRGWPLAGTNLDAACVLGLRVSVVGRSLPMGFGSRSLTGAGGKNQQGDYRSRRLPVEDHVLVTGDPFDTPEMGIYDRLRLTTTLMLRNRALGF